MPGIKSDSENFQDDKIKKSPKSKFGSASVMPKEVIEISKDDAKSKIGPYTKPIEENEVKEAMKNNKDDEKFKIGQFLREGEKLNEMMKISIDDAKSAASAFM